MQPPVLGLQQLLKAPAKMENDNAEVKSSLEEVNLGTLEDLKPIYISVRLLEDFKTQFIALLTT